MPTALPVPRRRWRPRFSLRSLLLAALFCGSAMLVWTNRAPFAVKYAIQEENDILGSWFSPTGSYFFTTTFSKDMASDGQPRAEIIKIYETETGRLFRTITCDVRRSPATAIKFSPSEKYLRRVLDKIKEDTNIYHALSAEALANPCELFNIETGTAIQFENVKATEFEVAAISPRDNFAVLGNPGKMCLVRLPSLEVIARLPDGYLSSFSFDEKWLAFKHEIPERFNDDALCIISTETGKTLTEFTMPSMNNVPFQFLPNRSMLCYPAVLKDLSETWLIEIPQIKTIAEYKGIPYVDGISSWNADALTSFLPTDSPCLMTFNPKNSGVLKIWNLENKSAPVEIPTNENALLFPRKRGLTRNRLLEADPLHAWDVTTGASLWTKPVYGPFSPAGDYAFVYKSYEIMSAETGETVQTLDRAIFEPDPQSFYGFDWAPHRPMFLTFNYAKEPVADNPLFRKVKIWHRRRPEQWWGYFYLPETWLALTLFCALIWNVTRPITEHSRPRLQR